MKFPVTILVDVDTEAYANEYDEDPKSPDFKENLRQHIRMNVHGAAERGTGVFLRPSNPRGYIRSMKLRGS